MIKLTTFTFTCVVGGLEGSSVFQLLDHYTYPHLENITQLPKKIYSCVLRKQILIADDLIYFHQVFIVSSKKVEY